MAMKSLEDLFVDKLKDIHDAEKRITKALPKMIKAASSEELSSAFQEHLHQTETQIQRLEQIFKEMGKAPGRKTCHGMMGILEEGAETLKEEAPDPVMDAALISGAQEVEHYEIGAYGCLRTWAELLGKRDAAKLLETTLKEEEETDKALTKLASSINRDALEVDDDQDMAVVGRRTGNGARSSSRGNGSRSNGGTHRR